MQVTDKDVRLAITEMRGHYNSIGQALPEMEAAAADLTGDPLLDKIREIVNKYDVRSIYS